MFSGVIYGDNRHIGGTLSNFLGTPPKKQPEPSCGYDISMFVDEDEANKYLCAMYEYISILFV